MSTTTLLLQKGAKPDMPDAEGTPPLIHAVQAESAPVVRLLLQAGANPAACDADGRDAASYSRSSEISDLLPRPLNHETSYFPYSAVCRPSVCGGFCAE